MNSQGSDKLSRRFYCGSTCRLQRSIRCTDNLSTVRMSQVSPSVKYLRRFQGDQCGISGIHTRYQFKMHRGGKFTSVIYVFTRHWHCLNPVLFHVWLHLLEGNDQLPSLPWCEAPVQLHPSPSFLQFVAFWNLFQPEK